MRRRWDDRRRLTSGWSRARSGSGSRQLTRGNTRAAILPILRFKPFRDVTVGWILVAFVAACFGTLCVLYGLTFPHRTKAQAFFREFTELKIGSSFAEAQRLARRYGGIPWYVTSSDMRCTFERCNLAFQFDNLPLSYVPVVGYTRFLALVSVRNGTVDGQRIEYEHISRHGPSFSYFLSDYASVESPPKGPGPGVWRLQVDSRGVPHVLQALLGPNSTSQLRKNAYSLNLSCLAKLLGCGTASAIYPNGLRYLGPPLYQGFVPGEE
jgi:hypothetical protein